MRRSLIVIAVTALALAAPAAAGLPHGGTLVPAHSLGGVRLGESKHAVRASLGTFYGVCDNCARPTWYFTYRRFDRHGLAVELERGRVSAVYTLWRPEGWRTGSGLRLGATPLQVHDRVGSLHTIACSGYDALVADGPRVQTVYYLYAGHLWGFGLFRPGAQPCR
jgi:hypothetical protein